MITLYDNYNKSTSNTSNISTLDRFNDMLVANSWVSQAVTFGSNKIYDDTVGQYDSDFSLSSASTKEILKSYGITSSEQLDELKLTDIRNEQQLVARLNRYKRINEAHRTNEELYGKVGSFALGAVTSIITDPTTLIGGGAVKATTKTGELALATAEGAGFGLLDSELYNEAAGYQQIDPMTASLFGAGMGGMLHSFALSSSFVSTKINYKLEPIDVIATQDKIDAKKKEIEDKEKELLGIKDVIKKNENIESTIIKLETDITKHTDELKKAKKAYSELSKKIATPEVETYAKDYEKITKLKKEIAIHEDELFRAKNTYKALEKDVKLDKVAKNYTTSLKLRKELNSLKKENKKLETSFKEVEYKYKKTDDLIKKKESLIKTLKKEEEALLSAKNTYKSRSKVKEHKYKTKRDTTHKNLKKSLAKDITKHSKELKELRARIKKEYKDLDRLKNQHSKIKTEYLKKEKDLHAIKENLAYKTKEYKKVNTKPKHIKVSDIENHIKTKGLLDSNKEASYNKTLTDSKSIIETTPDKINRKKALIKILSNRKPKGVTNKDIESYLSSNKSSSKYKNSLDKYSKDIDKLTTLINRKKVLKDKLKSRKNTVDKQSKELEIAITNHLNELNKELKELVAGGSFEQKIEQASRGRLETFMGIALTPITMLQKSNNPVVRGLGNLMAPPYKALVDSAGNFVATKMTAAAYKAKVEGIWLDSLSDLHAMYNKFKSKGDYSKSFEEFMVDIVKEHRRAISNKIRTEFEHIKLSDLDDKQLEELVAKIEKDSKPIYSDTVIGKGAERLSKYFIDMGNLGTELGVSGFKNISTNGMYMPRKFSFAKLKQNYNEVRDSLFRAMKEHPANHLKTDEELLKDVTAILDKVKSNNILNQFLDRVGEPTTSQQNARKIYYYEDMMEDYLEQNGLDIGQSYSYAMSGRFAGQKMFGVSTVPEMKVMLQKVSIQHAIDPNEIKALHVSFDTLFGIRELDTNPGTLGSKIGRIWTKLSSIVLGPGFVLNSLAEFSNIVATTGIRPVLNNFFSSIPETVRLFKGEKLNTPYMNELRTLGLLGNLIRDRHFQRWDGTDSIQTEGWLEEKLAIGSHLVYKYSGLQAITEATRVVSLASGLHFIIDSANKYVTKGLPKTELKRLARLGIDENTLNHIVKHMEEGIIEFDSKGNLTKLNFNLMNKELADIMENAIFNHLNSTVLNPNGFTLPMFMTESSPLTKIMFQFMRYPFAMTEQLGLKGFSEFDIKQINGLISNFMLFTMIAQIKDIGATDKRYDLDIDKGLSNTFNFVMSNNYMIGSMFTISDLATRITTGKSIDGNYISGTNVFLGASGSMVRDLQHTASELKDGELKRAIGWLPNPAAHIIGFGNIVKEVQKELRND